MNIYKFQSQYFSNGLAYASEVFVPGHMRVENIMAQRALPDEELTSESSMCVHNKQWNPRFKLQEESVEFYIWEKRYVDAVHRLMYLSLIIGVDNVTIFDWFKDEGLMHQLVHLKTNYKGIDCCELVKRATAFESHVPGTFLWATEQIKT